MSMKWSPAIRYEIITVMVDVKRRGNVKIALVNKNTFGRWKKWMPYRDCISVGVYLSNFFLCSRKSVKEYVLISVIHYYNFDSYESNVFRILRKKFIKFIFLKSLHYAKKMSEIQYTKVYQIFLKIIPLIPQTYILQSRSKNITFCLSVCLQC